MKAFASAPLVLLALCLCSVQSAQNQRKAEPSQQLTGQVRNYVTEPLNIAVLAGESTSFVCITNTSQTLSWHFYATDGSPFVVIVSECVLNPAYSGEYGLMNVGTGRCDLLVRSAKISEAGTYACQSGFDAASAQLAVIHSEPLCTVEPQPPMNGENITWTCDVTYTSNISPMLMTWTDSDGQPVPSYSYQRESGSTVSSIVAIATQPTLPLYTCTSYFSTPIDLPSTATNTPDFRHAWTSSPIVVKESFVAPMNTVGMIGDSLTLSCRRRSTNIAWMFDSLDSSSSSVIITLNCNVVAAVSELFRVESSGEACHLIINSLAVNLVGTYTCQDMDAGEKVVSAEVIALESNPSCSQNTTEQIDLPAYPVGMQCSLTSYGSIRPEMIWSDENGVRPPYNVIESPTFLQSSIEVAGSVPSLRPHSCVTQFNAPSIIDPPAHLLPATNAPSYTYNWTSTIIPVVSRADCADIYNSIPGSPSGLYTIKLSASSDPLQVYCDMTSAGGGWTVLQRRQDGSEMFYRDWSEYVVGFGNKSREFYLGNDNIAALTATKRYRLRIDMGDWVGNVRYADYANFNVSGADDKYRLTATVYTGSAGDALQYHNQRMFSTYDQDNDGSTSNCAQSSRGAWWYAACTYANLNGEYNNTNYLQGVLWYNWLGYYYSMRFTDMKIRPTTFLANE